MSTTHPVGKCSCWFYHVLTRVWLDQAPWDYISIRDWKEMSESSHLGWGRGSCFLLSDSLNLISTPLPSNTHTYLRRWKQDLNYSPIYKMKNQNLYKYLSTGIGMKILTPQSRNCTTGDWSVSPDELTQRALCGSYENQKASSMYSKIQFMPTRAPRTGSNIHFKLIIVLSMGWKIKLK
jgi:hypothetical protein